MSTNSPFPILSLWLVCPMDSALSSERGRRSQQWTYKDTLAAGDLFRNPLRCWQQMNIHLFKTFINKLPRLHFVFCGLYFTHIMISKFKDPILLFCLIMNMNIFKHTKCHMKISNTQRPCYGPAPFLVLIRVSRCWALAVLKLGGLATHLPCWSSCPGTWGFGRPRIVTF